MRNRRNPFGWKLVPLLFALISTESAIVFAQDTERNEIYEKALPAIVKLYKTDRNGNRYSGSGFIYDENGGIVTNYHVVRNAKDLRILHLKYKRPYKNIQIEATDPIRDLALLRVHDFKGFINAQGKSDKEAKPIQRENTTDDSKLLPVGHTILALTNPAGLLNIYTEGIVSGHENIIQIVPERETFLTNSERYQVILFTSKIAGGSSGGVLLDASGKAVGIATGTTRKEFIGFGIPITYVNALIQSPKVEAERKDDPYYHAPLYQWETEELPTRTVSGLVLARDNRPIQQARVEAFGSGKELNISPLHALPVWTDDEGWFEFKIPEQNKLGWKIRISHVNYQTGEFGPFKIEDGFKIYYRLSVEQGLVRPVLIFRAEPDRVGLKMNAESIFLHSFTSGPDGRRDKPLIWKSFVNDEWVKVKPVEGKSHSKGQQVMLSYVIDYVQRDSVYKTPAQIEFVASDDNKNQKYAFVEVYANEIVAGDYISVSGVVTTIEGGTPNDVVFITPYVDETAIRGEIQVNDDGYFHFRIHRQYDKQTVRLHVKSALFFVPEKDTLFLDLAKERRATIKMSPVK